MPIDAELAAALGLRASVGRGEAAKQLLRLGTGQRGLFWTGDVDEVVARFVVGVGESLADHCLWDHKPIAVDAPRILASVAPHQVVPKGPAQDLAKVCMALLRKQLPTFIGRIVEDWVECEVVRSIP